MPGNPADGERTSPHININGRKTSTAYSPVTAPIRPTPRREDYVAHAAHLLAGLGAALQASPPRFAGDVPAGVTPGTLVEVETMPPGRTARQVPDLDFAQQDIKVLQTRRTESNTEVGVVFVPDRSRDFLRQRLSEYGASSLGNRERQHVAKFEVIETIRPGNAESLFVGKDGFDMDQTVWWELWVIQLGKQSVLSAARRHLVDTHPSRLQFPDIEIIFVHATSNQIRRVVDDASGKIAEIRRAATTPEVMLDNGRNVGQADWVDDLVSRLEPPPEAAPAICVHDTGVAAAHELIAPGLTHALAYDDDWNSDDHAPFGGHGTPMVGLVLHGDLFFPLQSGSPHRLTHWVESVKILPPHGFPDNEPASYGDITQGAIAKIEIEDPTRRRAHCLAVTDDVFDPSQPSSWSGAIDQACAGAMPGDGDGAPRRMFLIASGNTIDDGKLADVLVLRKLEDPAQAGTRSP
jgi:hypothetical protein